MGYPAVRLRRLRRTPWLRETLRETRIVPQRLFLPIFLDPALSREEPIAAMPGQFRYPLEQADAIVRRAEKARLGGLLLFGRPERKREDGAGAWDPRGVIPRFLRRHSGRTSLTLIADVCLCAYTRSGHCGLGKGGRVDNDTTLSALSKTAVAYASAGADWVAPSAMADGQVSALRAGLDGAGFKDTAILSYGLKSASALYEPFREAEDSAPEVGDRKGYQMDYANAREGLRELALDVEEGADALMVKPGLTQLDLLWRARERFTHPLAAYHVSGEYAQVKAAAEKGWVTEERLVPEILTAFFRAGADLVVTYHALEAVEKGWL